MMRLMKSLSQRTHLAGLAWTGVDLCFFSREIPGNYRYLSLMCVCVSVLSPSSRGRAPVWRFPPQIP